MADRISEQCFDLAIGLYACNDSTIEDCGTIRRLVRGLEVELLAANAEVERLRADLREALRLLGQVNEGDMPKDLLSTFRWLDARDALLAKHKETNQ